MGIGGWTVDGFETSAQPKLTGSVFGFELFVGDNALGFDFGHHSILIEIDNESSSGSSAALVNFNTSPGWPANCCFQESVSSA